MNRLISPSSLAGPWSHGESAALEVQHKWPESSTSPASPACAKYAASQRPVSAVCSSGRCILRPPLLQSGPSLSTAAPSQHQCLGPRVAASTTGLITVRL